MYKQTVIFTIMIISLIIFSRCDNYDSYIEVVNKTDKAIIFKFSQYDTLDSRPPYTLSDLKIGLKNLNRQESSCFVGANSSTRSYTSNWKAHLRNSYESQTLRVFIFDPDTLQKYPWERIKNENKFWHKFSIPLDALEQMNWSVVYSDSLVFEKK